MRKKRAAYFGTNFKPGHYLFTLRGRFTKQEINDLSDVYMVKLQGRGGVFTYKGFTCLYLPYSLDEDRLGSRTIIMVEKGTVGSIKQIIRNRPFIYVYFIRLFKKYGYTEDELISIFGDRLIYKGSL